VTGRLYRIGPIFPLLPPSAAGRSGHGSARWPRLHRRDRALFGGASGFPLLPPSAAGRSGHGSARWPRQHRRDRALFGGASGFPLLPPSAAGRSGHGSARWPRQHRRDRALFGGASGFPLLPTGHIGPRLRKNGYATEFESRPICGASGFPPSAAGRSGHGSARWPRLHRRDRALFCGASWPMRVPGRADRSAPE
jgi:hypothetical protein